MEPFGVVVVEVVDEHTIEFGNIGSIPSELRSQVVLNRPVKSFDMSIIVWFSDPAVSMTDAACLDHRGEVPGELWPMVGLNTGEGERGQRHDFTCGADGRVGRQFPERPSMSPA